MTQEITDAMLDERARRMADDQYSNAEQATREALKVERESYKWIRTAKHANIECIDHCTCGLDAHKQVLRTRLGITE